MKFVEPISSAVLITACVYSAGISQNNSFLRTFNLHPEFSQPALDKLLYDGGIIFVILFWVFNEHFRFFGAHPYSSSLAILFVIFMCVKGTDKAISLKFLRFCRVLGEWSGLFLVAALFYMTFAAYDKGQEDGVRIARILLDNCYEVKITSGSNVSVGCAFRKDKDSIWYYVSKDKFKVFSETLTEASKIEYTKPLPRFGGR